MSSGEALAFRAGVRVLTPAEADSVGHVAVDDLFQEDGGRAEECRSGLIYLV
jgi:hypothetical protein